MSAQQNQKKFEQSIIPDAYTSRICKLFADSLEHCSDPQVLDVGPVCEENIMFFSKRVKRLFVCDIFSRLHQSRRKKKPFNKVEQILDYPERSFDGILLWDLVDRLDEAEAKDLIRVLQMMIRPGGTLMIAALSRQTFLTDVNTFVMGKDFHITFRPQKHLDLYMNHRHNREIMTMFSPLSLAKAQINKTGFREFLLQRSPG